jgi:hypothetical protein
MPPKLNRKRAPLVLTKIDEILAWGKQKEAERDTRFVELGRYLCEVRARHYWRLENLKSLDEFQARRFPESPQARRDIRDEGAGASETRAPGREHFDCATWLHKARGMPEEDFRREVKRELTGKETEPSELNYFKSTKAKSQ